MTIEWLGVAAVMITVGSYAMEQRHPNWVAVFAAGCALAAFYAFLIGSYPFLVAEGIWAVIAGRRWLDARRGHTA